MSEVKKVMAQCKEGKSFNFRSDDGKYDMKTRESEPFAVEPRYLESFPDVLEEVDMPAPATKTAPKGATKPAPSAPTQ